MEYTPEEEERIKAIQRHLEGEEPAAIYRSIGWSKHWFNLWRGRYKTGGEGAVTLRGVGSKLWFSRYRKPKAIDAGLESATTSKQRQHQMA